MTLTRMLPFASRLPALLKRVSKRLLYFGASRRCPVCGITSRRFLPSGNVPRLDARCPHCRALERHRLLWLYLTRNSDLFDGKPASLLHVAPEPCLAVRFRQRLGEGYLTADLYNPRVDVRMDITAIPLPAASVDVLYCSHVLEHVQDDRKAMREFHRVLRGDGWAILNVPTTTSPTFEDPAVTDPRERLAMFGQEDHVRRYGPDYVDRLREAGFTVEVITVADVTTRVEATHFGLTPAAGVIYRCTR